MPAPQQPLPSSSSTSPAPPGPALLPASAGVAAVLPVLLVRATAAARGFTLVTWLQAAIAFVFVVMLRGIS